MYLCYLTHSLKIVFSDPNSIQSKSNSVFSNRNVDRFLEVDNENANLESVVEDHYGSISDVLDGSKNDSNWEMECLNYDSMNLIF